MADSTTEKLSVDSVSLATYAWNVRMRASRWKVPTVRGDNVTVPGRHGSIYVPDKKYDEGEATLTMWVLGANTDGSIPTSGTSQRDLMRDNAQMLAQLFSKRYELVRLSQILPDGTTIEAYAEVTEAIDFTSMAGATRAEFSVSLRFPDPFWQDTSDVTYTSATGLAPDVQLAMTAFDGASAPMDDLAVVVSGPATSPQLVLIDTGATLTYSGTLTTGKDWRVNSATWESVTGTGIGFAGAGTNVIANTFYAGSTRMFSVNPWIQSGHSVIQLKGSGFGAGTQVKVKGRRKYLLG